MSTSGADSEFSTPLQSQRTSRHLSSPTSCSSVYFSAADLQDFESNTELDATELCSNDAKIDLISADETNGVSSKHTPFQNGDLSFLDGRRSIDYVLVYREDTTDEMHTIHKERREIFHTNLEKEGLELEVGSIEDIPLRFVKIHVPYEVCTRYAEILKMRMPMKKKVDERLLRTRVVFHIPGIMAIELNTPTVLVDMTDFISKMFNFVRVNPKVFPPKNRHFTAIYSRNKEYLFDMTEELFTPSIRARIADFILRRKKFKDSDDDQFAFGIEKLLSDETYAASYPIHEIGDLLTKVPLSHKILHQIGHKKAVQQYVPYGSTIETMELRVSKMKISLPL